MTKFYIRRKFLAALIDYSIIFTIFFLLVSIFGRPSEDNHEIIELKGFPAFISMFLPWFISIVCFETFLGATLGNGIVGLKPVDQKNKSRNLTFIQSFQRHLLDPIDMFFFGLIGYLVMKNNNGQRLGDIWAKTVVVKYEAKKPSANS